VVAGSCQRRSQINTLYIPRANKPNGSNVTVVSFMPATALQRCVEEILVDAVTPSTNGGLPGSVYTGSLVAGRDVKCSLMQGDARG
jgi:hypothetical protein